LAEKRRLFCDNGSVTTGLCVVGDSGTSGSALRTFRAGVLDAGARKTRRRCARALAQAMPIELFPYSDTTSRNYVQCSMAHVIARVLTRGRAQRRHAVNEDHSFRIRGKTMAHEERVQCIARYRQGRPTSTIKQPRVSLQRSADDESRSGSLAQCVLSVLCECALPRRAGSFL